MRTEAEALYEWASARATRLSAARMLSSFRCAAYYRGSGEPDDPSEPRCYHSGADVTEWCDGCQQRDKFYPSLRLLRAVERKAFRRLERVAKRIKQEHDQPRTVNAGATPPAEGVTESATDPSSTSFPESQEPGR